MLSHTLVSFHPHISPDEAISQISLCVDGTVNITGESSAMKGKVEVCKGGEWWSICHGGWGFREAAVVCSQLGYPAEGETGIIATIFK